jgi:acetyl esterase/lipase
MSQSFLKAGEDGYLVTRVQVDDSIRQESGLGDGGREEVLTRDTPQDLAPRARGEQGSRRTVDGAVAATGDLVQRAERQSAVRHWLGRAAKLYANGTDLKNPYISPIYGDFSGFPPAILTSGTRDLFLSNTVRTHRKLRRAGVEADLNVYEGQSHAQYGFDPSAPETKEAFTDIANFFDRHLGN